MCPSYNFRNEQTGEEYTEFFRMSELDEHLSANPHIKQLPSLTALVDPVRLGVTKPDARFRERLKEIKAGHSKGWTKSTIRDR
jgi:hypothetical protein